MAELAENRKFTYGDYQTWNDDERWELIGGRAYNMSPAPSIKHQSILGNLYSQFSNYLKGKPCKVLVSPVDVRFPSAGEKDQDILTVVQPDLVIVCDREKIDEKGIRGAPTLIVEVLSPFTARKDLKDKFDLYERHGVREYWVVHPIDQTVMVFVLNENQQFGKYELYSEPDIMKTTIFDDLEVNLQEVFAD